MGLLKRVIGSMKKSQKLSKISKVLGKPADITELMNSIHGNDDSRERAEEELYDLVESNPDLMIVMQKYGATKETLKEIYHTLSAVGAGQWTKGHFVLASALAFGGTLDYLLRNKDKLLTSYEDKMEICFRLITYFEKGEIGYILD